jgi:glycerophosphoryl diester phosphodiesterase
VRSKIIAHRGASKYAPENTMPAFELAYQMDADGIETDVQLTKDKIPILIHDENLTRTTNGSGMVKDYTLEELKMLDAGSYFSRKFRGVSLLTLNEFLEWAKDKALYLNLELKNNKIAYKDLELKVLEAVYNYQLEDWTILSSFNSNSVKKLRKLDNQIDIAFLWSKKTSEDLVSYAKELGASSLHLHKRLGHDFLLQSAKEEKLPVRIFTVNRTTHLKMFVQKKIAGIMTDVPDRAIKIRNRY